MLSVGRMSAQSVDYYLGLASHDEYYTKGGEPPGFWIGEGCHEFRLDGAVLPNQLRNLFQGISPDGGTQLVRLSKRDNVAKHHPGWDFTFSADKTISVLWSQATVDQRRQLEEDIRRSVQTVIEILEDRWVYTRRGAGGRLFEKSSLIGAAFEHCSSRAGEPNLHVHVLVLNVGVRPDGQTGSLSGAHLFSPGLKMMLGALFRCELAQRLERRGLEVERRDRFSGVAGVSAELCDRFSSRRKAIEEALSRAGDYSAVASATAALKTREAKVQIDRAELIEQWRSIGRELGWHEPHASSLFGRFVDRHSPADEVKSANRAAAARVTKEASHFGELEFARALAEESPGRGLGAREVMDAAAFHLHRSPEIVRLGSFKRSPRYTTHEVMREEADLLERCQKLAQRDSHSTSADVAMRVLAKHPELSEEQMKAVWHMTVDTKGIALISGYAGSGKTSLLRAVREIFEAEGVSVGGTALAGRAQAELQQKTGIPSRNCAQLLADVARGNVLPRGSVLVLDEAGMISTPTMLKLVKAVEESDSKLIAIGHEKQLQPIERGGPFRELGNRLGKAELVLNRRQQQEWARTSSRAMADGDTVKALQPFIERDLLTVCDTKREALQALVEQWVKDGMNPHQGLMIAGTNEDVATLNEIARAKLIEAGVLGHQGIDLDGTRFVIGDTVKFTKTAAKKGLSRGDRGDIVDLDPERRTMTVLVYANRAPSHKVTVSLDNYPHIARGLATTAHMSQGATSLNSYVFVGGDFQHRELSYVQVSRSEKLTHLYTTPSVVGDDTAARLAREMHRSRAKDLAHSVAQHQQEVPRQQDQEATHERR
ncbi:MAG: relaxase domain-containing protein [Fimbriimonadaceae bacterium]|nr:relaxase domain-containing protein [Fimbriimonadaceae bacterium]